jgi:hypothetical protein
MANRDEQRAARALMRNEPGLGYMQALAQVRQQAPSVNPADFTSAGRAVFRSPEPGKIEVKLDGVVYPVEPFGDDAVQVVDPKTHEPIATLKMAEQGFVLAGQA